MKIVNNRNKHAEALEFTLTDSIDYLNNKMDTSKSNYLETNNNEMCLPINGASDLANLSSNGEYQSVFINGNAQFMPKCPLCEKTFANSSNLKHHMNTIHFNEAKWICNECKKVCTSKSNLKVHLRVHLRVKPYYCRWCDYNCMHHSSIRDHLSKCHPEKSHNSCEPGYIFNSTAVPEPELSHYEPSSSLVTGSFDITDDSMKKVATSKKPLKSKRAFEPEKISNDDTAKPADQTSSNSEELNFKKFKIEIPIEYNNNTNYSNISSAKLKLKTKKISKKCHYNKFDEDQSFTTNERREDLDDNENNNNTMYNSEDEHNSSMDNESSSVGSNLNAIEDVEQTSSARLNLSNSSPSSISSNASIQNNNAQFLKFNSLAHSFPNFSSNPLQNELFSNLFSSLPLNLDPTNTNNNNNAFNISNLAAALVQRLTNTATFINSFNNSNLKNAENLDKQRIENAQCNKASMTKTATNTVLDLSVKNGKKTKNEEEVEGDEDEEDEDDFHQDEASKFKPSAILKNKFIKRENFDLAQNNNNKDYYSKSTNLIEENFKENNLKFRQQKNLQDLNSKKSHGNKGIIDVINRLSSRSAKTNDELNSTTVSNSASNITNTNSTTTGNNSQAKNDFKIRIADCNKNEHENNLEELNDLIKSHLLPLSEVVIEKYLKKSNLDLIDTNNLNNDINNKKKTEDDEEKKVDDEELNENESEEHLIEESSNNLNKNNNICIDNSNNDTNIHKSNNQCTFCNILKNLMDLHALLHKS